jgi:predicted nucleotidyltransferase
MKTIDLESIRIVVNGLGELANRVVFVGGAVVSLYATNPVADKIRATTDIDCIIEISPRTKFPEFEEVLRGKGFVNDLDSPVICRWIYQGITVDIMPTDESIMGFTNLWYKEGIKHAQTYLIDKNTSINIFTAPYFVATKLEAMYGRKGINDIRYSSDFEDIVYIIDNREDLLAEIAQAPTTVKNYLKSKFFALVDDNRIEEYIEAVANDRSEAGIAYIKKVMQAIGNL